MGNPVRPWKNFLTVWERLDFDAQSKVVVDVMRTLRQLRAYRKDLDARIAYWEDTLDKARAAKRNTEFHGRGRERHERVIKPKAGVRGNYRGRFTQLSAKAAVQ